LPNSAGSTGKVYSTELEALAHFELAPKDKTITVSKLRAPIFRQGIAIQS
jgi:hypothetical protein